MSAADLIARARDRAETLRSVFPWGDARLIDRLADALEAVEAERDAAVKELRDRELHHFEVEEEPIEQE